LRLRSGQVQSTVLGAARLSSAPLLLQSPVPEADLSRGGAALHWQLASAQPLELAPNGNGSRVGAAAGGLSGSGGRGHWHRRPGERPDPGAPGAAAQRGLLAVLGLRHGEPGAGARALLLARGGGAGGGAHRAARPLAQRRARVLVGRLRRVRGGRPVPHQARRPDALPQPQFLEQGWVHVLELRSTLKSQCREQATMQCWCWKWLICFGMCLQRPICSSWSRRPALASPTRIRRWICTPQETQRQVKLNHGHSCASWGCSLTFVDQEFRYQRLVLAFVL
jgi:hypothetical protein